MPGAAPAIPESLEGELLARAGELNPATQRRWTTRDLAGWLAEEHRIKVDPTTVARTLTRLRAETANAWAAEAREQVQTAFGPLFDNLVKSSERLARAMDVSGPFAPNIVEVTEGLRKVVETFGKFTGLAAPQRVEVSGPEGGPVPVSIDDAREALFKAVSGVVAEPDPGRTPRGPGETPG